MILLQSQTNILIFGWYLILQISTFVIILLIKKQKKIKPKQVYYLGSGFGELSHETRINLICHMY
jgi:Uri superfamily endonuclease